MRRLLTHGSTALLEPVFERWRESRVAGGTAGRLDRPLFCRLPQLLQTFTIPSSAAIVSRLGSRASRLPLAPGFVPTSGGLYVEGAPGGRASARAPPLSQHLESTDACPCARAAQ